MRDEVLDGLYAGEQEAYLRLVEQYGKLLWVVVSGVLKDVGTLEDMEECVSDAFIALWENPQAYRPERGSLKAYLAAVARNRALDRYRQLSRSRVISLEEATASTGEDPLEELIGREGHEALFLAVRALREPDREILIRRYFFDQRPRHIALQMGLPVKVVENRLYQSKRRLQNTLRGEEA